MKRGVITFTKAEIEEIFKYFNLTAYVGFPIESKLNAARLATDNNVQLELSEEELESILDSVILLNDPNADLISLRDKIQKLLLSFRAD